MLVIDKERDCAILGRQSRFVPRMWSCLAGFIEVKPLSRSFPYHVEVEQICSQSIDCMKTARVWFE